VKTPSRGKKPLITGELKSKIDRIWDTMWSGGISNPLSVIDQLTYLLFIKRLDELQTLKEAKAARMLHAVSRAPFTGLHAGDPDGLFAGRTEIITGIFDAIEATQPVLQSSAG
jgi:hypothetical protein